MVGKKQRLSKIYVRGELMIVCFKGDHYRAPKNSQVDPKTRVPITTGSAQGTVNVQGETWFLKGSYIARSKPTERPENDSNLPKVVAPTSHVDSPREDIMKLIEERSPSPDDCLMLQTTYKNWLKCTHLILYKDFEYENPNDTQGVRSLGLEIMKLHGK